jgi:alpha-tubulin suppressor-like RCC1 family protein
LTRDGTVWKWGVDVGGPPPVQATLTTPVTVEGLSEWLPSRRERAIVWPSKRRDRLGVGTQRQRSVGDGTTDDRSVPSQVSGLSGVIKIAAGESHSVGLRSDGTVWTWGWTGQPQSSEGITNPAQSRCRLAGSPTLLRLLAAGHTPGIEPPSATPRAET